MDAKRAASVALCVWIGAATAALAAAEQQAPPEADVFGMTNVWRVHLQVTDDRWKLMQPTRRRWSFFGAGQRAQKPDEAGQAGDRPATETERLKASPVGFEYAYVKGTVQWEATTYQDVGIRFKGNSSYAVASRTLKRPFKLDFNRFVEAQQFFGMTQLNLHNNALDPSEMREALSYAAFRQAGIPAPRTAYALVYLTIEGKHQREFLGLYTIVEQVNRTFLGDRFGTADGLLVKPERVRGGVEYMGEQWKSYETKYEPKTTVTPELAQRLIDFTKLVNQADDATFAAEIGDYLAVDQFLRFLAVNVLLSNLDSFLTTGHNFYLYVHPQDKKLHWIPWDLNLSFGGFSWPGTGEEQMELSIRQPHVAPNRLVERLLAVPEIDQKYRAYLDQFSRTWFSPEDMHRWIDDLQQVRRRAAEAADEAGKRDHPSTRPATGLLIQPPSLREFVTRRVASVRGQLAGEVKGYAPSFRRIGFAARPGDAAAGDRLAEMLIRAADSDADDQVSEEEWIAAVRRFFIKADTQKKDVLDETALLRSLETLSQPAPHAQSPHQDDPSQRSNPAMLWARIILREADRNRNGQVSLPELLEAARRAHEEADRSGNGLLDAEEAAEHARRMLSPLQRR